MATFTWTPDKGASKAVRTRVNAVRFGEGYEQRVAEGINSVWEEWTLRFTARTRAEIDAIDAFLTTQKGVVNFDWTTPQGVSKKFICKEWSPSYEHDYMCELSAVFEQRFET